MSRLLAGHLQQSQMGPAKNMRLCAVTADDPLQTFRNHLPVLFTLHINKINDNNASRIPQADQTSNFLRRQQIRARYRLLQ
ncbi:hypothetical protein D3C79_1009610 [compost metagenome]